MLKRKFMYIRMLIYIISIILIILVSLGNIQLKCNLNENYGIICPACGLTRATINIVKLDFANAFYYNAYYTCILIPFLAFLIVNDIYIFFKRILFKKKGISFVEIILEENNID